MRSDMPAKTIESAAKSWYSKTPGASIHFDREDAIGEAWVISFDCIDNHDPGQMTLEGYLYQRIHWRLSNMLTKATRDYRNRKRLRHHRRCAVDSDRTLCQDILDAARVRLSGDAYQVLSERSTATMLAGLRGIPRRTLSRHIASEIAGFRAWARGASE